MTETAHQHSFSLAFIMLFHSINSSLDFLTGALVLPQKRQINESLDDRVVVTDEEVEIRYVIPTSPKSKTISFCHRDETISMSEHTRDHESRFWLS